MPERALKFCMVTTFYPPHNFGGDGIYVYRLANALALRGHRVDVVYCRDAYELLSAGRPTSPPEEYGNHPNVTVHGLRSGARMLSLLMTHQTGYSGLHTPRLRRILDDGGFDVIHYHNVSLIGLSALRFGSGAKLYTLHDHWLVCPLHVLWKFDRMPCTRKQCIPCTVHARRPPQLWRYTRMPGTLLDHVDAFIALSHFSREKHKAMGLAVRAPIVYLPHFVPVTPSESNSNATAPHPAPFFLVAGRLEKLKGVQVAIEAFRRYRDCDLIIAGDGPYRARLEQDARGLPHVRFRGKVGPSELQKLYRHAVALIVPSIGYESFGTVIVEAFAQGTPAIVHNLGALPELVGQSGGGVTYDDASGLLDALRRLHADPGLRDALGERGHRAYRKYWTADAHLAQYFALIDRILSGKAATGLAEAQR